MTGEQYAVVGVSQMPYLHMLLECGASEHVSGMGTEYTSPCRHFLLSLNPRQTGVRGLAK